MLVIHLINVSRNCNKSFVAFLSYFIKYLFYPKFVVIKAADVDNLNKNSHSFFVPNNNTLTS